MSVKDELYINPTHSGISLLEQTYKGYSWPCAVFGPIWFAAKNMQLLALILFLPAVATFGLIDPLYAFFANRAYISFLIKKGYTPLLEFIKTDKKYFKVDSQISNKNALDYQNDILPLIVPYVTEPNLSFFPNIPVNKLSIAMEDCKVPENEEIVVLFDDSFLRSSRRFFLIGLLGLYFFNSDSSEKPEPGSISYKDLSNKEITKKGNTEIDLGNGDFFFVPDFIPINSMLVLLDSFKKAFKEKFQRTESES